MVSIEPRNLEFPFDKIIHPNGSKITIIKHIKIRNTGTTKARYGFQIIEKLPQFEVVQSKLGSLFPGEYAELMVKFTPDSWDMKQVVIYVKDTKDRRLYPVNITGIFYLTAFPSLINFIRPKNMDFGHVMLYEPKQLAFSLSNNLPLNLNFSLSIVEESPPNYFAIDPQSGVIPANETININIIFVPLTLCRAQMKAILNVSSYGFCPVEFLVYGIGNLLSSKR